MKPPAVPAAAAHPRTREGNRGDSNDGQQFVAEGQPPVVQSALYGCADAEANMIAAGRQTHTQMKGERQKEGEKQSQRQKQRLTKQ